ncbi:MAG: ferredoxin [Actinomycetota bacterium]|nr:ferredoxin [Actinomycetota bacterium]
MVVQLAQPCLATYTRRARAGASTATSPVGTGRTRVTTSRHAGWRISVDRDLCQGHAVCQSEAPRLFSLPKGEHQVEVLNRRPTEEERAAAEAAVRHCPTHALTIVED